MREKMLAMQALWSREEADFHGDFVSFEKSWMWPKPIQQPRPSLPPERRVRDGEDPPTPLRAGR